MSVVSFVSMPRSSSRPRRAQHPLSGPPGEPTAPRLTDRGPFKEGHLEAELWGSIPDAPGALQKRTDAREQQGGLAIDMSDVRTSRSAPGRSGGRPARSLIALACLMILGGTMSVGAASADTASDLRDASAKLDDLVAQIHAATQQVMALQADAQVQLAKVDSMRQAVEATQARLVHTQITVREITQEIAAQQATLDQRAVNAYVAGPSADLAAFLSASSFQDFTDRLADVTAAGERDHLVAQELGRQRDNLAAAEQSLEALYVSQRAAQDQLNAQVDAVLSELQLRQTVLDGLNRDREAAQQLVTQLTERRQQEIARQLERERRRLAAQMAQLANQDQSTPPTWWTPPTPPPGYQAEVVDLIKRYFTPLGRDDLDMALCVAWRESRYTPTAVNKSSGAAGVFQFMPNLWPWFSSTAGWDGADVFDPNANVGVAAAIVKMFGWWPWRSDSGVCGI
jgi:peptidoglycan hydrolase CwlO-like protein